jgi:tellurite methyltransferase
MPMPEPDWPAYFAVTADRPPWPTVVAALELFGPSTKDHGRERYAVDLGCGAGRDSQALLRSGWRVLAIDREPTAIATLLRTTAERDRERLEARVLDLVDASIPRSDLVNASLSLPFLPPAAFDPTWLRMRAAVRFGGRLTAILFGDRDEFASDPTMTCRSPSAVLEDLGEFEIERFEEREEDRNSALGDPHHYHLVEVVARRIEGKSGASLDRG